MIVKQYELAIELSSGGEWLCDVTEHSENDTVHYEIEVDPPVLADGPRSEIFPMEMRFDDNGVLLFVTEHALTEDLQELETILAREILEELV